MVRHAMHTWQMDETQASSSFFKLKVNNGE
jgi:hypothetical protein